MPHRLEITLKPELFDAEGEGLRKKAADYFNLHLERARTVHLVTIDAELSDDQLETIRAEIFTNPVTQISAFTPLAIDFDWCLWVGFRPGVRDNAGATAVEAIEDVLGFKLPKGSAAYTSRRYCIRAKDLTGDDADRIAGELLSNDIIQNHRVYHQSEWDADTGVGIILPKVRLDHIPTVTTIPIDSDETLARLSEERNLALNPADIPIIRSYFLKENVQKQRKTVGLTDPTDVELEYISQARSDHCNHNTFQGRFRYTDLSGDISGKKERIIDNPFKTCIKEPTIALKEKKPWVISVLWDNAGVARFDDDHYYVITGETHNSPSNMEAYGGAITGIVGIYRDPMGTGKGARLIMGSYGFCVGPGDYDGDLAPRLHPRRLLDGVIEGVRDGGNKSGIPTTFGQVYFHPGYMGKCLVFVTAVGMMPALVPSGDQPVPADQKDIRPGDRIIMCGGRVGKDGIHGVTASSEVFSESTPAGHVQIGDPYTQKKMHDFLLLVRDEGLIEFITDNGGGGLSSSIGESAMFSNGCRVDLEKVPLKYDGLDQWEIWISESQERMTVAVSPENVKRFMTLSRQHAVESTVIGEYTDTGKLHITYDGNTCAFVDLDFLSSGFPQWKFEAAWHPPEMRGLTEPVQNAPTDYPALLCDMLSRPNIAAKQWVPRQYDHEVQGTSIMKPLVGRNRDIPGDAAVIRPVLTSERGLAFSQALLPQYSQIDTYHMTACAIDEAVRRLVAAGADPDQIGGVDNFCWPSIQYHPDKNPDGKYKAAQLVRSCEALKNICEAYEIPLLSGKDSMYVDGHLTGRYGETRKISAPPSLQFSASAIVPDINRCVTLSPKLPEDLVYLLGDTRNELGGSEYYAHMGYTGLNVPKVFPETFLPMYQILAEAINQGLAASAHGIYTGGIGVHLALSAMGGQLGIEADISLVPGASDLRPDQTLFSESAGRFLVTVAPENRSAFEALFKKHPAACIGRITKKPHLRIHQKDHALTNIPAADLSAAWKQTFGDLI